MKIEQEQHFFPRVSITANPDFSLEEASKDDFAGVGIDSKLHVRKLDDTHRYFCEQRVKITKDTCPEAPYYLDVVCLCFLSATDFTSEEEENKAAIQAAYEVLFPAVRELILTVTARQPWGQFSIGNAELQPVKLEEDEPTTGSPPKIRKVSSKRKRETSK